MAVRIIDPSIKTGANTRDQIKIPDYSVNGIENYQKVGSGVCYDTSTSDTAGTWTVTIPNITALTEGLTVKVRLKTSYNSTTNTLNVNGLGAKTVYFRYGTKLTSHYSKESVLALTYSANAIGSGTDTSGWIVENIYDSTNTQQLRVYNTRPKTKSALYRYMICFVNNDGLLIPANNVNNSTATTKTLTTESFNLFDSIYYYNSTTTVSANGQVGSGTLYKQLGIDLRYSFNTGTTLVAPNGVYLKVTADGSQFKLATDNPITQSLPTSDDGYFYCYLGRAYSATNIELVPEHPIYLYKNGIIQEYSAYIKSVAENAVKKSGDTMTGSLTIQEGNAINVSQYNDAGGTSLMNNGGGTATQFGSSTRPARMFSSVQPEWYKNGASQGVLALKSDIPDVSGKLSKTENTGVSVLGTTKSTTTLGGNQLVAPNGIIFAGTAANAGLVTRGICGVSTPDSKGACSKDNLYINYDGNNTYNTGRMLILQAGETGTNYGNNMYQYAVPRGDIVKAWVEAQGYAKISDIPDVSGKANLSGGNTFSGSQTFNIGVNQSLKVNGFRIERGDGLTDIIISPDDTTGNVYIWKPNSDTIARFGDDGINIDDDGVNAVPIMFQGNAGTAGQVLTSQGDGKTPIWKSMPTYSLSGTTLTITLP